MVEGEGFEPSKLSQQIYSLPPLTARESLRDTINWSWREESNPRPADYKSAALPTELRQRDQTLTAYTLQSKKKINN